MDLLHGATKESINDKYFKKEKLQISVRTQVKKVERVDKRIFT